GNEEAYFARLLRAFVIPAVEARSRPDVGLRVPLRAAIERVRMGPPRFAGVEARMIPSVETKETHHPFRAGGAPGR
ncbi:MAG TPA: hypothetical protein VM925_11495, partial [Labilithrix sp.]|nr:hypothetical protein [Labilithrix sp.]